MYTKVLFFQNISIIPFELTGGYNASHRDSLVIIRPDKVIAADITVSKR